MPKSKSLPKSAVRLAEYADLARYARAFAKGHFNLLVVCGGPGLGKSRCLRHAVGTSAVWIDGNATAFGLYLEAYEHRDRPIVLDDVDGLQRDRNGVRLLKALCQTEARKSLSWQSDARTLERRGIPCQFETCSRLTIIANEWRTPNADVAALEDRAQLIVFEPSAAAVHRQAGVWFHDQEIFDFVGANLHLIKQPSLRTYNLAKELKNAGMDWRSFVLARCLSGTAFQVARIKADPAFQTEEERVRAFVASGACCRATYFNYSKRLSTSAS